MAAGLCALAFFSALSVHKQDNRSWSPVFAIVGFVAVITGFVMSFTWPLPYPYNIAFGELSVLFGFLYLAAAVSLVKSWNLMPICIYAFFAGLTAVVVGVRFIDLGLSQTPVFSGTGFMLTGLTGILMPLLLLYKDKKIIRFLGALLPLSAAFIWAWIGYFAYWFHLAPKN